MRRTLLSFMILLSFAYGQGQVTVDNSSQTVTDAIQNTLIGEGVDVFGVMINGQPGNQINLQAGTFEDPNGDIGLMEGIIMATGDANLASQPNTGNGSSLGSGSDYSFAPLEALTPFSVNDQCVIEFDFIPQGDTLTFQYVFASEEYPEYVCGSVNDVFGFFLSGNNPDGGLYDNENLALIPDPNNPDEYTNTPVSINSVNPGEPGSTTGGNSDNCDDMDPDWADYAIFYTENTTNTYEYDGSTVVLTARAIVNCGEVYHITLAIGDGGDTAFDSAVFLEANSFSAEPTGLVAESLFPLGLVEISDNCDEGFARLGRPCAADTAYYILNYLVNDSTAVYGVDYEALPTEIMLPTFVSDSIFPIITIPDGIAEDTEYICIELSEAYSPDGPYVVIDTTCIAILDNYTFDVSIEDQILYCPEQIPVFTGFPQSPGVAPFVYSYFLDGVLVADTNPYSPPIPAQWDSTIYTLGVVDFCGAVNNPTEVVVGNRVPNDPTVTIGASGQYCPGLGYPLSAQNNGGTFPFYYTWTDEFGGTYEDLQTVIVDPQTLYPGEEELDFHLLFEDNCTPARTAEADITITYPDPILVDIGMNDVICIDQELELSTSISGGYPPYDLQWSSDPVLLPWPDAPSPTGFLTDPVSGEGIAFGFYVLENMSSDTYFYPEFTVHDWCSQALLDSVIIPNYHPPGIAIDTVQALNCIYPNVVSPNDDGMNDAFVINELINRPGKMFIYNRWGNLLAETNRHLWAIDSEPAGTYFYVVQFEDGEDKKGYFTIVR